MDLELNKGKKENRGAVPLFFPSHRDFDNGHRVIAKNIHDLNRNLAPSWHYFLCDAGQVERTIFLGAKRLPFVLEHVITSPDFLVFLDCHLWRFKPADGYLSSNFLDADNFFLALEVKVH